VLSRLYELLERGEWVQVKREAERLMMLPDLDSYALGRIYRVGGRACIGLSEFHAALKLFELGLPYALQAEDWDTIGFIRHDSAAVSLALGDTATARAQFEAYLMGLSTYSDARRMEGKAHYNLGLLYRQQKQYDLAVAAYRQALNCFVQRGATRDAADAHQNIAWLLLVRNRPDDARIHIDLAAGFQDRLPEDFRTEQLILLGYYYEARGELRTAAGYLEPILTGRMTATHRHMAAAHLVEARMCVRQGDWPKARVVLNQAVDDAITAKALHIVDQCVGLREQFQKELGEAAD
jgi:tetratricopeptide (TPR) repeat protein